MQLAEDRPNVELRRGADGSPIVVLAFPYDPHVLALVRRIPGRRFDWDRREWYAPVDDWAGVHVAEVVDRFPELTTSAEVDHWLRAVERRWVGRVTSTRHDGRGWFVLHTRAGEVPQALRDGAVEGDDETLRVPVKIIGLPADHFVDHGAVSDLRRYLRIDSDGITEQVHETIAELDIAPTERARPIAARTA